MYEDFFRLNQRPFSATPQVDRYYPAASIEQARKTICRCIERAEGTALIIGPSGTGKSLLCQVLARQFSARFQTAVLTCGNLGSRRALLQAVLFELGQPYLGLDEGELRLSLVNHLLENAAELKGLVLFVDEAHTLPWRLLEELRLITNLSMAGETRVRMVLAGNGTLEEQFANPKLDSFSQRVAARCYLGSLDRSETASYVRHQIGMSGGNPATLVASDALESVYRATDGIPRLVNQVCDHALILASLANQTVVQRSTVEEAWADLQQLPSPWVDQHSAAGMPPAGAAGSSVVEFGDLDDADDCLPASGSEDTDPEMANSGNKRLGGFGGDRDDDMSDGLPATDANDDANDGGYDDDADDDAYDDLNDEAPNAIPFHRNPPAQSVDLEMQLGSIEVQLARYDEDFRPAGLIGPEVELVFADASNPFEEQFAEEEIVVDRYAALDTGSFAGFPTVSSSEGRELGARLTAVSRPRDAAASNRETPPRPASVVSPAPQPAKPLGEAAAASRTDSKTAVPLPPPEVRAQAEPSQASASHLPSRLAGVTGENWEELEDRDLIVIEDDPPVTKSPRPKPLVRRQEYRQLFAKLRRG